MSIEEWEQWIIRLLVSEGTLGDLREETIREQAGQHYDLNFEYALKTLMDKGITSQVQSEGYKRYSINFDKLEEARKITHKYIPKDKIEVAQPYLPEPKDYEYWFDHEERRTFRKQNKYRIFKHKNGERSYVGQLLGKSMRVPENIYTGSLDDPESYISRIVKAMHELTQENSDGVFILQNIQDKDRKAVGNNRQRGKVVLSICEKLGMIEFVSMKGNSASFRLSDGTKLPTTVSLDSFTPTKKEESSPFSDPEWFEDDNIVEKTGIEPDKRQI